MLTVKIELVLIFKRLVEKKRVERLRKDFLKDSFLIVGFDYNLIE